MTTTMGLAMAMTMAMLAAVPMVTVWGSVRWGAVVAMVVAKESWAEGYGVMQCGQC